MASEKSFTDRLQRSLELHTALTTMTPAYAPADAQFSLPAFAAALETVGSANSALEQARPPYQDQTRDRVTLVKSIGPRVTQALAYVKSNTAWANRLEAVKKAADKVRGVQPPRASSRTADPEADAKLRERGERSFLETAGHLRAFLDRLQSLPGYQPPDGAISHSALGELWSGLDALNRTLPQVARTLADAITDRQQAYTGPTGLKFVYDGVKVSVKGQYGQQSVNYKKISGMRW